MVNYLLSHRWSWQSGAELGLHTLAVTTANADPGEVVADAAVAFVDGYQGTVGLNGTFATDMTYTSVVANEIANLTTGQLNAGHIASVSLSGTGAPLPPQISGAVSLTAGTYVNGAPVRGRFYLPPADNNSFTAGGRISSGVISLWTAFVDRWFDALVGLGMTPCVWSRKLGALQPVTEARIGDVCDTIRSRRNGLEEAFTTAWPV